MKHLAGLNKANTFTPNSKCGRKDAKEESHLARKLYLGKNAKV